MFELRSGSLRSRVARRIFSVFLFCTLIPFAGLVIIAYTQVATFFNEKNQRQLREMAKAFGMDVHVRLSLLEAELQVLAARVRASRGSPGAESVDSSATDYYQRLTDVVIIDDEKRRYRFFGSLEHVPEPTPSEKQHLASGKTLVSTVSSDDGKPPRVLLTMVVDPADTKQSLLVGVADHNFLWGVEELNNLPGYVKPCFLTRTGSPLMCAYEPTPPLLDRIRRKLTASASGAFEWSEGGKKYLASYWTIPTKFVFHAPGWTVVLRTSKEGVFASVGELARTFFLGVVAALGFSILLAIHQLRKRLTPLEKLQESTRRIGNKDFAFRVNIRTNDEFEELATSLNSMAGQLGRQFNTLETTAEIGRAVLSLLDTSKVVEVILGRMMNILGSDCAALTLFDSEDTERLIVLWNESSIGDSFQPGLRDGAEALTPGVARYVKRISECNIPRGEDPVSRWVASNKAPWSISDIDLDPRVRDSKFLKENALRSFLAAPLIVKEEVVGVLSFFSGEYRDFTADEIGFVGGLTSQAAIAIYNAELYERTKRQAVELERSNMVKDEFLNVMSHELRTPLTVVTGYAAMIQEGLFGEVNQKIKDALSTVTARSNDLLSLLNNILDATKIESEATALKIEELDLNEFMKGLEAIYRNPLDKQLVIQWHYSPNLPIMNTDPGKLKRILQSLISNGIKFTDKGFVTISAAYNHEKQEVEFSITDTGIGIPERFIDAIFEKFSQVDSSTSRPHDGAGLGLYIVKKFMELLGGRVTVTSEVGKGSCFTVIIPTADVSMRMHGPAELQENSTLRKSHKDVLLMNER